MAAPTQQYPPWLTPIPETIFGPGGVPISTSTTILYLPLTYYGPSIPLGSEWVYGGLTPPALTSTVVVSTTVTPSSSTSTATPSSTPSSTLTSTSTTSSASSTASSQLSSSTISSTAIPSTKHGLSHNQLIGIIIGAVIGALGDGSPRHSGEERDSLLQAHNGVVVERSISPAQPAAGQPSRPMQQIPAELGARPGTMRAPVLPPETRSSHNSGTSGSSTEMSSLGSVVPNSRLSRLSPLFEQREIRRAVLATPHFRGPILTPQGQRRIEETTRPESSGKENDESSSSLPPPPRSMDPDSSRSSGGSTHVRTAFIPYVQRNIKTGDSYGSSNRSSAQTDIEDCGPSPYFLVPSSDTPNASPNATSSTSGGIMSSINSRLSWFRNLDALSVNRRSGVPRSSNSSDRDPEVSKALLSPIASEASEPQSPSSQVQRTAPESGSSQPHLRPRLVAPGLLSDGTRPMSGNSARSGASSSVLTYYDAMSSLPNTPTLIPPPRAVTPAPGSLGSQPSNDSSNWRLPSLGLSSASLHMEQVQQEVLQALAEFGGMSNEAYLVEHAGGLPSSDADVDALDAPVPAPLRPFRNTFGVLPMDAPASTSTAFSNSNTITSTGTSSASTSESSLEENSNETAMPESPTVEGGPKQGSSPGTSTFSNMVHIPFMGADVFAIKSAKSWSDGSGSYSLGMIPGDLDEVIIPSRETSRSTMTGTTLATIEENTASTAISIDLLEEEPPLPGEGWRSLASVVGGGSAAAAWVHRRLTLGAPALDRRVPLQDTLAEDSDPASRRDISGSSGSRSSGRYSIPHSGSVSSLEGRRRYMSSLRYQAYSGSQNSGSISPTLSAFGSRSRRQGGSDDMLRNFASQHAAESGSSYYTAPDSMSSGGSRSTNAARDIPGTTLMEIEEDVVDAARAAMNSGYDREFGVRSPKSPSDASLGLNWIPL
ncbi:hypothetical protein F5887DRAFT_991710 [Amanita rubescens]|nr:hypothetical protein F5887DRAFT_991710 [Amanita rubescens]